MGNRPVSAENTFRFAGRTGSKSDISGIIRWSAKRRSHFRIVTKEVCDVSFMLGRVMRQGDFKAVKKPIKFLGQLAGRFHM